MDMKKKYGELLYQHHISDIYRYNIHILGLHIIRYF